MRSSSARSEEGHLCFFEAKFTVVDPAQDDQRFHMLDFLSFLEALGHVGRYKEMPRGRDLEAEGLDGVDGLAESLLVTGAPCFKVTATTPHDKHAPP